VTDRHISLDSCRLQYEALHCPTPAPTRVLNHILSAYPTSEFQPFHLQSFISTNIRKMSDQEIPNLKLLIKPEFDGDHQAVGFHIVLDIESPSVEEGSTIVSFPSIVNPIISQDDMKFLTTGRSFQSFIRLEIMVLVQVGLLGARPLGV
jgi:hypothetical protein